VGGLWNFLAKKNVAKKLRFMLEFFVGLPSDNSLPGFGCGNMHEEHTSRPLVRDQQGIIRSQRKSRGTPDLRGIDNRTVVL